MPKLEEKGCFINAFNFYRNEGQTVQKFNKAVFSKNILAEIESYTMRVKNFGKVDAE